MPLRSFFLCLCLLLLPAGPLRAQERVSFPSADAARTAVHALLFRPAGEGPFPAVVALHGCGGLFNRQGRLVARERAWAQTLTARGYLVLFPDSFGARGVTRACADAAPAARPWVERSADAYGALAYLQARGDVIPDRIGLMGWSHGGGSVLFAIADASPLRPALLPKGDFRAAVAFYPGWCSARRLGAGWRPKVPLLLELGAADDWTPAAPCVEIVQSAVDRGAPARIALHDGAWHDFDWPGMAVRSRSPRPGRTVHTGMDPEARAQALVQVPAFFDDTLKK